MDYEKKWQIYTKISELFNLQNPVTFSEIKQYLNYQKIDYLDNELSYIINFLFIKKGIIVRNDYWDKEADFFKLDEYRQDSNFSKHYYSFKVDNYNTKKFLLISDTHIGNSDIEDFLLINNIYEYAIANGATKCFHLGDLFAGDFKRNNFELEAKKIQINSFITNYPHPFPNEILTYGLLGNHDQQIIKNSEYNTAFDLRNLNFFNPSFYLFPRERWTTTFLDKNFHFGHRFHHSQLIRDLKITCVNDLIKQERWLEPTYDVNISGHLHKGLIYGPSIKKYGDQEKIYLGVPSTSKININGIVGYLVTLNYKDEKEITSMDIDILSCDSNYRIAIKDIINWNFKEHNTHYKKAKIL